MQDYQQAARIALGHPRPTICLLMDVANIPEDAILPLVQELRQRGQVAAMFAFADWHRRDMHLRHRLLDALGFMCIHGGSWENGSGGLKSMVDSIMKRAIKWMPQWFANCDTYVLATGDRDFSHDASDLRWRGFRVWIAAGETSINNELRLGAEEFINLDRLPGRTNPAALLGVPPNYYEANFGGRGRYSRNVPSASAETAVSTPGEPAQRGPVRRMGSSAAPAPVQPAPRPIVSAPPVAAVAPVIVAAPVPTPAPAPVAAAPAQVPVVSAPAPAPSDEDRDLIRQLRDLAGEQGFVPQREALRSLAPAEDPGGRIRSRLSNQIRDLVERGLLTRAHTMIGGNLTQVLSFPGVTVPSAAEETAPAATATETPAGERRGRARFSRRGRTAEAPADVEAATAEPVVEAPEPEPEMAPTAAAEVAGEPEAPAPVVARQAPAESSAPRPAMTRRPERERPAIAERAAESRSSEATVVGTGGPRVSWRDAVAAALARARNEAGQPAMPPAAASGAPGAPATGTTNGATEAPGVPSPEVGAQAEPALVESTALQTAPGATVVAPGVESADGPEPGSPAAAAVGVVESAPAPEAVAEPVAEETPAPANKSRRRRASPRRTAEPDTTGQAEGSAPEADATPESAPVAEAEPAQAAPARRRAPRRRSPKAASGEGEGQAGGGEEPAAS